jgi:hypothetical protein
VNRMQVARQLAYLCGASGALGATASAFVSSLSVESFLESGLTFPIASVQILNAEPDPDFPARMREARFRISVAGIVATEVALSGPRLGSGGTQVSGKDLSETIRDLIDYLNDGSLIDSTHGMQGYVEDISPPRLVTGDGRVFCAADIDVVVFDATALAHYHKPARLLATVSGGGAVALSWGASPLRFDTLSYIVRQSANGGAAPTTISGGTGVTLGSVLATSVNVTGLTVGHVLRWSIFTAYDETTATPTTADKWSDALASNQVTVT